MYYTIEFYKNYYDYKDENEAKKIVSAYSNIDRSVKEGKLWGEALVWEYVLGSDSFAKLENVINDLYQKFSKEKGVYVHELYDMNFFVFPDKNHPWFKERYRYKKFY